MKGALLAAVVFALSALALGVALVIVVIFLVKSRQRIKALGPVEDAQAEREKILAEVHSQRDQVIAQARGHRDELNAQAQTAQQQFQDIQTKLKEDRKRLKELQREVEDVEEAVNILSFAFYRPHYDFDSASAYAAKLEQIRERQKIQLKDWSAIVVPDNFTFNGSKAQGKKMMQEHAKLMLRAFNGECDGAIASVRYNNAATLEKRIQKSYEAVNALGKTKDIVIRPEYLDLKIQELRLVHEHREKLQAEKEEQQRIKEELRDEAKARAELERAQAEAEKEEVRYQKALEKARKEYESTQGAKHDLLAAQIAELEAQLTQALERKERAISQAQLTRSGHVYVISNVGSFGEHVYKIGMTRRLDPMDRILELGDASVPFRFDVHALIYTEDAPGLENALHQHFAHRRLNRINLRREFFRVTLDEIREVVKGRMGASVEFVTFPEAEEYRKSVAMAQEDAA